MINSKGKKYFVKQRRAGVLFILPSMLIFIIFVFVPLIMSFIYSTQTFNMMFNNVKFVGASNYIKLLECVEKYCVLHSVYSSFTSYIGFICRYSAKKTKSIYCFCSLNIFSAGDCINDNNCYYMVVFDK